MTAIPPLYLAQFQALERRLENGSISRDEVLLRLAASGALKWLMKTQGMQHDT